MSTAIRPPARRALYAVGHDRHPDRQRQQQLLDRFDRAVPGPPGGRERRGRLRAGGRLRADEARRAGRSRSTDRPSAVRATSTQARDEALVDGLEQVPMALRYFGGAGQALHATNTASTATTLRQDLASRRSRHAANNPFARVPRPTSRVEEVLASPHDLRPVLTRLQWPARRPAAPPRRWCAVAELCRRSTASKPACGSRRRR